MDELANFWNYPENMDHVQQKLVCTTLALEAVKKEANDELKKYKQYIKHLSGLLKVAYQERDESKNQLQKVLDNLAAAPTPTGTVCLTRANSSITESNNSYGSPTVDSFVSSPDSTNMAAAIVRNQPYNRHGSVSTTVAGAGSVAPTDVIDDLCRGLALPQKGSLLKVVMDSGPLLSSLLVSGPLPQWKNPPPLQQLKIPTFPIINVSPVGHNMCSAAASMMNFGAGSSRGYQNDDRVPTSTFATGYATPVAKRQRFQ